MFFRYLEVRDQFDQSIIFLNKTFSILRMSESEKYFKLLPNQPLQIQQIIGNYLLLNNIFHRKLHYRIFSSLHATMTHGTLITLKYLFSMKQKQQKLPMMLLSPSKQRLIFSWTLLIFQNCKKVLLFPMTGQKKTQQIYTYL